MEFKTNWSDVLLAMARSRHTKEARPLGVLRPQHDCRARGGTASRLSAKHNTDLYLCSQQHDRRWRCAALAALFCSFFVRKTRARRTTLAFQQKATRRKGKGTFAIIQSRSALCSLLTALCSSMSCRRDQCRTHLSLDTAASGAPSHCAHCLNFWEGLNLNRSTRRLQRLRERRAVCTPAGVVHRAQVTRELPEALSGPTRASRVRTPAIAH